MIVYVCIWYSCCCPVIRTGWMFYCLANRSYTVINCHPSYHLYQGTRHWHIDKHTIWGWIRHLSMLYTESCKKKHKNNHKTIDIIRENREKRADCYILSTHCHRLFYNLIRQYTCHIFTSIRKSFVYVEIVYAFISLSINLHMFILFVRIDSWFSRWSYMW